jgi:dTDP-4-dehydrorhamnose reductase
LEGGQAKREPPHPARQNETLRIVDDQISNPTWARMLAETTALLIARGGNNLNAYLQERPGLYHLAGDSYTSRLDWATAILSLDHTAKNK